MKLYCIGQFEINKPSAAEVKKDPTVIWESTFQSSGAVNHG